MLSIRAYRLTAGVRVGYQHYSDQPDKKDPPYIPYGPPELPDPGSPAWNAMLENYKYYQENPPLSGRVVTMEQLRQTAEEPDEN